MKPHSWVEMLVSEGPGIGAEWFWVCSDCGAGGGPVWHDEGERPRPFLVGSSVRLPEDCGQTQEYIRALGLTRDLEGCWHVYEKGDPSLEIMIAGYDRDSAEKVLAKLQSHLKP